MIEGIKTLCIDTAQFNSILGICLYWAPMSLCVIGYTLRTARNLRKDLITRRKCKENWLSGNPEGRSLMCMDYYAPTDTVGTLIGRAFVSIMPVANIWAAMFDVAPALFGKLFDYITTVFNQPLVPWKGH